MRGDEPVGEPHVVVDENDDRAARRADARVERRANGERRAEILGRVRMTVVAMPMTIVVMVIMTMLVVIVFAHGYGKEPLRPSELSGAFGATGIAFVEGATPLEA